MIYCRTASYYSNVAQPVTQELHMALRPHCMWLSVRRQIYVQGYTNDTKDLIPLLKLGTCVRTIPYWHIGHFSMNRFYANPIYLYRINFQHGHFSIGKLKHWMYVLVRHVYISLHPLYKIKLTHFILQYVRLSCRLPFCSYMPMPHKANKSSGSFIR